MAAIRQIIKKRVGPDGIEIDCADDQSKWIDIKESKRIKYQSGTGEHFRRTHYHLCNNSERREYEAGAKITFKNPENEETTIEYLKDKGANHGIVKSKWIAAGRGEWYQKTKVHFCNTEENNRRQVREQRVENEQTGDYITVERIERLTKDWGKGASFQRKNVYPCSTEEQIRDMEGDCKELS